MTSRLRYLAGLAGIGALTAAVSRGLAPPARGALGLALVLAVAVQGPLGWWLIGAVGTARFLVVWGIGIGARVGLVAVTAFIIVPVLHLTLVPVLVPLALLLVALLGLEALVLLLERRAAEVQ